MAALDAEYRIRTARAITLPQLEVGYITVHTSAVKTAPKEAWRDLDASSSGLRGWRQPHTSTFFWSSGEMPDSWPGACISQDHADGIRSFHSMVQHPDSEDLWRMDIYFCISTMSTTSHPQHQIQLPAGLRSLHPHFVFDRLPSFLRTVLTTSSPWVSSITLRAKSSTISCPRPVAPHSCFMVGMLVFLEGFRVHHSFLMPLAIPPAHM